MVCTTRICEAELRVGLHSSGAAGERAKVEELLSQMIMLELNAAAAEQFGRAKAHLLKIGRPASDFDTLIALIALANGQRLITRNPRHFAGLPGLVVETY